MRYVVDMNHIVRVSDAGPLHGGKAQGLRRLMSLGCRVPEALAFSTEGINLLLSGDPDTLSNLKAWIAQSQGTFAVRSSAPNEDGEIRSFAGIYETILGVARDLTSVTSAIASVSASGASSRVSGYVAKAVPVIPVVLQVMVDARRAGVLFTHAVDIDGESAAYVEWVDGLADNLVSGRVTPSSVVVPWAARTNTLERATVRAARGIAPSQLVDRLIDLTEATLPIHSPYGWDLEWAEDATGALWALQLRPATTPVLVPAASTSGGPLGASPGVARGPVRLVDEATLDSVQFGDVIVAAITEIAYVPAMRKAYAIVTEEGGLLSHAAIVARELGIPCVVGARGARMALQEGVTVEVNGSAGIVRQGTVQLGSASPPELDWTYLYLFDSGFELTLAGVLAYVEPTLDGCLVHIDQGTEPDIQRLVEAEARRRLRTPATVVQTDRRIWLREWKRFRRLLSVALVETLLRGAIARWRPTDLTFAITALKSCALSLRPSDGGAAQRLLTREVGAALHSLVWLYAEGYAIWHAFRDTAEWRAATEQPFSHWITAPTLNEHPNREAESRIRECLSILATLRNDAYAFFSDHGIYDSSYFSGREELMAGAAGELGLKLSPDTDGMDALYDRPDFLHLEHEIVARFRPHLF